MNLFSGPATLSPRFDGILRQTPPSGDKLGSITQGTPVHLPPHHLTDKQRVYDYSKLIGFKWKHHKIYLFFCQKSNYLQSAILCGKQTKLIFYFQICSTTL